MLPRVKIDFKNGLLGASSPSDDGVTGLLASATAIVGKFELDKAYSVSNLNDVKNLGIGPVVDTDPEVVINPTIYKVAKEYYSEAPEGSKLWIYGVAESVKMSEMVDKTKDYAKNLLLSAKGDINFLVVAKKDADAYTPTATEGLDSDVYAAMSNAQAIGVWAADELFAPVFTLIEGRHYTGVPADLRKLSKGENNRVAIVIGDTTASSTDAAVGLLAGRIASIPVQRSAARVRSGAVKSETMYIGAKEAENGAPDDVHNAGFITPRTFVGKAGYFWSDDKLATKDSDDYALIPRRRVIDKAYRIAYRTLLEELNDEIPLTDMGTIPAPIVKDIQNRVESAIVTNMTTYGNLGVDPSEPNDTGVQCYIDSEQEIVKNNLLNISLRVKPHGYPKYIDVALGFKTKNV